MATTGLPPSVQGCGVARSSPGGDHELRGQQTVQTLDPSDDDSPAPGRHRASPSTDRTVARRAAFGAGCLIAAVLLGWVTAGALGLTGLGGVASGATPAQGASTVLPVDPAFERTVDIRASAPRTRTPASPSAVPPPVVPSPAPVPAAEAAPEPGAAPAPEPADTPAGSRRAGERCRDSGETAMTDEERSASCRGRGHGRTRGRHD